MKESVPEATPIPPPTGGEKVYSVEELMILAKIQVLMNGRPFQYLEKDDSISDDERGKRSKIASSLMELVADIRSKKADSSAFFDYQDIHFDEPEHAWLQELHPGVNVNGWRVIMTIMDPVKYGEKIDRPRQQVVATITKRSART